MSNKYTVNAQNIIQCDRFQKLSSKYASTAIQNTSSELFNDLPALTQLFTLCLFMFKVYLCLKFLLPASC